MDDGCPNLALNSNDAKPGKHKQGRTAEDAHATAQAAALVHLCARTAANQDVFAATLGSSW